MAHEQLKPWNPGVAPYAEWLKNLTPEEYAAHLEERKKRKTLKQTMKEVQDHYKEQWAAALHNAAISVVEKAIKNGDANAYATIYDRLVGRPDSSVTVSNGTEGNKFTGIDYEIYIPPADEPESNGE